MNFWMTPQRIYEELTGGPGPRTLMTAQGISNDESSLEQDRAGKIRQLATKIQGGWQGSAADGAYGAAQPLAASAMDGAEHLYRAQDLLDRQSGSFGRASNDVVPMPEKRPETGMLDEMLPTESDTEKQVKAYQADAQHNIQVFEGYDNASSYNENMPREYTITNHSGGTMLVTGGDTIDSDDYRRSGGESGGPGNYSAPGNGDPGGYPDGSTGGASSGGPLPGGSAGSQTSPSEYRPSPTPGGSPGGYPQSPAAYQPSAVPPGGFVPGTTGGYPGGSGGGPGSGGPGGRGGGPGGGVAGGPGAGGRVPGPGGGGGAGALAAEEAAARRGAIGSGAAGGRGGMGPMGAPMGAGRGKGDDDAEHQRKVLIEPDPESTFGSDVLTAPQVIGDDAYEDD